MKRILKYFIPDILLAVFLSLFISQIFLCARKNELSGEILCTAGFRRQPVGEELGRAIRNMEEPGEYLALCWLENRFAPDGPALTEKETAAARMKWESADGWSSYLSACRAIWNDAEYFPVAEFDSAPELSVTFEDSWMFERTYGGTRGHEGTDIIPAVNERGIYPVVSMTDGTVSRIGWLELGGYRIGIQTPGGAYFYYAHLDSYAGLSEGDRVHAGDFLGFMGDSGYGEEGTRGKFPVHLHLGIYLSSDGEEISVNPYPVLKYTERNRISAAL